MRLHEINDKSINELLEEHFKIHGAYAIRNNKVFVEGDVESRSSIQNLGTGKLPVQFGTVKGYFYIDDLGLETLEGSPSYCKGFYCISNQLVNLIGAPHIVDSAINFSKNEGLRSLDGLPIDIDGIVEMDYSSTLPMLRLLFIRNLQRIDFNSYANGANIVEKTLNKYLGKGKGSALQCAAELTKLGFKENAKL